MIKKEVKI